MKSSQILKKARKLIASGECYFICNAVFRVGRQNWCEDKSYEIEKYISTQLNGMASLGGWLRSCHDINPSTSSRKLKQTRLNWIDWMIAAYEEKGD